MNSRRTITLQTKNSIPRLPWSHALLFVPLTLACFALSPAARAVTPAPDGFYLNQNTAEGEDALFSLTTGSGNTAVGFQTLYSTTAGGGNMGIGAHALYTNTQGQFNTASGSFALFNNTVGGYNAANGYATLYGNTTGKNNTANGYAALVGNTIGASNTASGFNALFHNTSGNSNIGLGDQAGINLTTGSNNIDIGAAGAAGESGRIRIGTQGKQTDTFIAGIYGATVTTGIPVLVGPKGKLGTMQSSVRFKEAIKPMDKASEALLALKPVTFRYKQELDPDGVPQFGLVAEEVEKVNPDLVVRGEDGKVMTVRYEAVNAMLLNEFLKEHRQVEEQAVTIAGLKAAIAQQQASNANQQKQIEALTAGLQKVTAQVESGKSSVKVAVSDD